MNLKKESNRQLLLLTLSALLALCVFDIPFLIESCQDGL
jgi:hypothetical protein